MISSRSKNCKNRLHDSTDTCVIACRSKHIFSFPLVKVFFFFDQKSNTNSAFSYRFAIAGNLSFCFISMRGGALRGGVGPGWL